MSPDPELPLYASRPLTPRQDRIESTIERVLRAGGTRSELRDAVAQFLPALEPVWWYSQSVARWYSSLGALLPILGWSLMWSNVNLPEQFPNSDGSSRGATQPARLSPRHRRRRLHRLPPG